MARADLPARYIDHAQEGGVIIRVDQQAQVAHGVLDLVAGEKGLPAGDAVGDLVGLQFHFQQARLVIAPVEHGKIPECDVFLQFVVENFGGDALRLGIFAAGAQDADLVADAMLTPQRLLEDVRDCWRSGCWRP